MYQVTVVQFCFKSSIMSPYHKEQSSAIARKITGIHYGAELNPCIDQEHCPINVIMLVVLVREISSAIDSEIDDVWWVLCLVKSCSMFYKNPVGFIELKYTVSLKARFELIPDFSLGNIYRISFTSDPISEIIPRKQSFLRVREDLRHVFCYITWHSARGFEPAPPSVLGFVLLHNIQIVVK